MKRLRDMPGDEPLSRRGVKVLEQTPPTEASLEMKLRVWRSLQRTIQRTSAKQAGGGLRSLVFKVAIVALVALAAGTAGAVIARRWIVPATREVTLAPPASAPALPRPHPDKARPAESVPPVTETIDESRIQRPPKRAASNPSKKLASPPPASAAAVARERTEVLDALIALRRAHDPVRAGTLLSRYLSAHPNGALREEALVLAIEAADARADRAAGRQLSEAYQREFPGGRFLPFARSHIDPHP
jgi:hypothetical protein